MEKPKRQTDKKTKAKASQDNVVEGVTITHPDREVFSDMGITKLELAQYYAEVAPYMLADIEGHPISVLRCPEGEGKECFFQRNAGMGLGAHIKPFSWSHKGKKHDYFYTDSVQGIVELIQMGGIELHPWGSRFDKIDYPDRIVFDLDPDGAVPFEAVKMAALDLKNRLEELGLESFLKCSGGKGLHVRVPLAAKNEWSQVKDFARRLCEKMEEDVPEAYITNMNKKKRAGKIFLDYLRNDYTATSIADYAVRARKGAAVAVPLDWSELKSLKSANAFSMDDVRRRIAKKKPNSRQFRTRQTLTKKMLTALA